MPFGFFFLPLFSLPLFSLLFFLDIESAIDLVRFNWLLNYSSRIHITQYTQYRKSKSSFCQVTKRIQSFIYTFGHCMSSRSSYCCCYCSNSSRNIVIGNSQHQQQQLKSLNNLSCVRFRFRLD